MQQSKITIKEIRKVKNIKLLIRTLERDFIYLKADKFSQLGHNEQELTRLVTGENFLSLFAFNDQNKMVGYLVGEIKKLQDSRMVYYISYLHVSPEYRGYRIGSKLIEMIINKCNDFGYKFVMLTCDSQKSQIVNLYKKYGFTKDPLLGSNDRHCVYSLFL